MFRYDAETSTWVLEQELLSLDPFSGLFGSAVIVDGDVAVIGARGDDEVGLNYGAAYLFRDIGEAWVKQDKLVPAAGASSATFGRSTGLSGDLAVVGASGENLLSGSAYLYAGLGGSDCNANAVADSCDILVLSFEIERVPMGCPHPVRRVDRVRSIPLRVTRRRFPVADVA